MSRVTIDASRVINASEEDIGKFPLLSDEVLIERLIYAVARGVQQEDFLRNAFSPGGTSPAAYVKWKSRRWRRTLINLMDRLLCISSGYNIIILKTTGPRGGWWGGRFFIRRGSPPDY